MDRNKPNISRPGKSKIGAPHHGSEIFALGSKAASSSSSRDDNKSKVMASASTTKTASVNDRKREAPSTMISNAAKKPKLNSMPTVSGSMHPANFSAQSRTTQIESTSSTAQAVVEYWEQIAQECDSIDLVHSVLTAIDRQDSDQVVALLCGAIKAVTQRPKLENTLSLSLMYLAKLRPNMFCNEIVTSALLSVLRRDATPTFKIRNNPSTYVLAANLLARGYHNKTQWPESFVRHYIEDAINERAWVDLDDCSPFVDTICTAFATKTPPKSMLQPELISVGPIPPITSRETTDEDSGDANTAGGSSDRAKSDDNAIMCSTESPYDQLKLAIERLVVDTVKEQFNRRQAPDCLTRNFLRFLSSVSGISDIRAMAITRLELWIHNGKLMKSAQELLAYICYNVNSETTRDHEVLANLIKMRLKTKALVNHYMNCIREMINLQPDILFIVLKNMVQSELSNARNPNNMGMGMLASMFQAKPDESAQHLAAIYQEFLLQREDCLRTLRVFLRELVKMLRYDIKLTVFCDAFLMMSPSFELQLEKFEFRDRVYFAIIDLVCLCMFLSVSPQIREANVLLRAGRETKSNKILIDYYDQMTQIQRAAIRWVFDIVPKVFKPSEADYTQSLHKILLLDAPEQYTKGDQWPPEQERNLLMRLASEVPLHQDVILYLAFIGVRKDNPIKTVDVVELIEQVIRRAAGLRINDYPALFANNLEIIDCLFTMAEYHHPENIVLPNDYKPPKLAISTLYWKAWNMLLMLSAHNPSTFGAFCWENYPMLRNLMEMSITNQFVNKVSDEELQLSALEKTQILEFETHLAAASSRVVITEQNSLLLSQLILMDPYGVARKPPMLVLEMLQNQNVTLKLGHLLCRSRKPDLLLDIINRQGTSQSMPWLADLVQNSEGDFNHLPVQCLCEFLLSNSSSMDNHRDMELLKYLQNLLADETPDQMTKQTSCEVLEYFLRRLSSPSKTNRINAIKALQLLLDIFQGEEHDMSLEQDRNNDWLIHYLGAMPHFEDVRLNVVIQLRAACQIENNPELIMIYVQFIAENTGNDPVTEMLEHVMDLSQLIVERSTLFECIVAESEDSDDSRLRTLNCFFLMFNNYLVKLKQHKDTLTITHFPDLVMVHFHDGTQQPIHLMIIHAFVILLTYATLIPASKPILDYWFPPNATTFLPEAFSLETAETVEIFPDWLKLRMIRSEVERLVDAALHDLSPEQVAVFIQSFGIPVNSMSKLLALLDLAVIEQSAAVKAVIPNGTFFAQLIGIQQWRGAKNGHIALQTLQLSGVEEEEHEKREVCVKGTQTLTKYVPFVPDIPSQTKEIEDVLGIVLHNSALAQSYEQRFRYLIQQMLSTRTRSQHWGHKPKHYDVPLKVLHYMHRIAKSPDGKQFSRKMLQNASVCTLLRTVFVTTFNGTSSNHLADLIKLLLAHIRVEERPVLYQVLFNQRKNFIRVEKEDKSKVENDDLWRIIHSKNPSEIQIKGNRILHALLKYKKDPESIIDLIIIALKSAGHVKNKGENDSQRSEVFAPHKIGMLIDWLIDLDSELTLSTKCNLEILFGRALPQFRYYLLSVLSHQASWDALHAIVSKLLSAYDDIYDSTAVVQFIASFTRNPRLWQGREKNTSKHYRMEYMLSLDDKQLKVFTDYILNEKNLDSDNLGNRVSTLLQCARPEVFDVKELVAYVQNASTADQNNRKRFLQQLYLAVPPMKFEVLELQDIYLADASHLHSCTADKIINNIMTTITSLSAQRDFLAMSHHMELLLRKLAATHPSLVLRQFSMLATMLQGRAHMDFHVLRSAYHIPLFNQVFGIIESLQPHIFAASFKNSLHKALECYFTLYQIHGTTKDTLDLMYRFMEFLHVYTQKDSVGAWKFIEPHTELIEDLAADNRNIIPLQQLVQGVSLMKYKQSKRNDSDPSLENGNEASAVILSPYTKTLNQTLTKLLADVLHRSNDEVLGALQELEIVSTKRHVPMESIHERLLTLIATSSTSIRDSAYTLLIRHLKSNPGNLTTNANTLAVYVQCLRHKETGVVISALEFLTDIVICLQEYASEILRNAFEMGVKSRMNTFEHIRKCVLALKTQHAC